MGEPPVEWPHVASWGLSYSAGRERHGAAGRRAVAAWGAGSFFEEVGWVSSGLGWWGWRWGWGWGGWRSRRGRGPRARRGGGPLRGGSSPSPPPNPTPYTT